MSRLTSPLASAILTAVILVPALGYCWGAFGPVANNNPATAAVSVQKLDAQAFGALAGGNSASSSSGDGHSEALGLGGGGGVKNESTPAATRIGSSVDIDEGMIAPPADPWVPTLYEYSYTGALPRAI